MNSRNRKHKTVMVAFVSALMVMWGIAMTASAQNQAFAPTILSEAGCTATVNSGQSISAAVSSASSGSVICVRAGVYNEQLKMAPNQSGITVQAYPGETPILDGTGLSLGAGTNNFAGLVNITGSNITVEGFEIRNSTGRGVVVGQSKITQVTHNVTIRNMIVHDSYDSGIHVTGTEQARIYNIVIEGNEVYDNLLKNSGEDHSGGAALVFRMSDDSIARGNTIYHNHGEGLAASRYSTDTLLEGNVSYDNVHANLYLSNTTRPTVKGNFVFCTDDRTYWESFPYQGKTYFEAGNGLQIREEDFNNRDNPEPLSVGMIIINNVVAGCSANFGVGSQMPGGGLIDSVVANNTFINAQSEIAPGNINIRFERDITVRNSKFVNNLLVQTLPGENVRVQNSTPPTDLSTLTVNNNLYWPAPPSSWFSSEPGRKVQNPELVNPVSPTMNNLADPAWYALKSNSPAINAGGGVSQVTDDFLGALRSAPFDIGAFEYASAPATGQIRVTVAVGSGSGTPQASFASSFPPGSFQVTAGGTFESGPLEPGLHDVAMTPLTGWSLTGATCSDNSSPDAIQLGSGETVTCTFTIAEQAQTGTIIIYKETVPASQQVFDFTASYNDGFQLMHGSSNTMASLPPGAYWIRETTPQGWTHSSASCTNGGNPGSLQLAAGETVTCTFRSYPQPQTGRIIVAKQTIPEGAQDQFSFTTSYSSGFVLTDNETSESAPLPAGTYSVSIEELDGWSLTNTSCSDSSAPSSIDLAAGETVTCTFTSQQNQTTPSDDMLYISARQGGTVDGIAYGMQDILAYDLTHDHWSLYLDLSLLGISKNLNGFVMLEDGSVLMTFARIQGIDGLGNVSPRDIVRFRPTGTGSNTAGSFEWYFQGADVGLTTSNEIIDTLTLASSGNLLIGTVGTAVVDKAGGGTLRARDEDLLEFRHTQLGANTAGTWVMYFDGSSVPGLGVEDVNGAWLDAENNDLYITVNNGFNIAGKKGNAKHIVRLRPNSGGYSATLFWYGPDHGFNGIPNGFVFER